MFPFLFLSFFVLRVGNKFGIDKLFHTPFQINKIERNERIHNEIQILKRLCSFSVFLFFCFRELVISLELIKLFYNPFQILKEERDIKSSF